MRSVLLALLLWAVGSVAPSAVLAQSQLSARGVPAIRAQTGFAGWGVFLEPSLYASRDSDGYEILRTALRLGVAPSRALRGGVLVARVRAADAEDAVDGEQVSLFVSRRVGADWRLDGDAGVLRIGESSLDGPLPIGMLRARWTPANRTIRAEARAQRNVLLATPDLLREPVIIEGVQGRLSAPVAGPLGLRANGRVVALRHDVQPNVRTAFAAGPGIRILPGVEAFAQYSELRHSRETQAGYFAPRRVQGVEVGLYAETEFGPVSLSLDAAAGPERLTDHDGVTATWDRGARLWAYASAALRDNLDLAAEFEFYDSRLAATAAVRGEGWSQAGAALYLTWSVR
jgi:hypothetical protein